MINDILKLFSTDKSDIPTSFDLHKEANSDLRAYLSQIVEALRWIKQNQNRTSILVISTQVALLTKQAEAIFSDAVRICLAVTLALLLLILLLIVYPRSQRALRLREISVFEHLSAELRAILVFHENPDYRQASDWPEQLKTRMDAKRADAGKYLKTSDLLFTLVPLLAVGFLVSFHIYQYYVDSMWLYWFFCGAYFA